MNELSLFSGAGGGLLGTSLLGWRLVGCVENNPYCQEILRSRMEDGFLPCAPIFGDIRDFISGGWAERYRGLVDVVSAGFPCQPFSVAGKGLAHADDRNFWPETAEVLRIVRPAFALLENVPGLLSGSHNYFKKVLSDLASLGFDAEWRVLGADDAGAPHRRKRLWIVAASESLSDAERGLLRQQRERFGTKHGGRDLNDWAAKWPTPTVQDAGNDGGPSQAQRNSIPLNLAVKWPTPTSGDAKSSGSRNTETSKANPGVSLTDAIRGDGGTGWVWPTPSVASATGGQTSRSGDRKGELLLAGAARAADADYDKLSGHLRGVAIASGGEATPARSGLSLNPDWVELLMGWPRFWTKIDPMPEAEFKAWLAGFLKGTVRFGEGPEYGPEAWADGSWERGQARVGTQIENRVGRLRALGNGQVPICVVLAWLELADRLNRG